MLYDFEITQAVCTAQ